MRPLVGVTTVRDARAALEAGLAPVDPRVEKVALEACLGRVLARRVISPEDVPSFDRSTVDGYAVRAGDVFGASEGMPAYLKIAGEIVMGREPDRTLVAGEAIEIPTGGMLPAGADAVVMVEHTELLGDGMVAVTRPVAPGANVLRRGEDMRAGAVVLEAGRRLRPQDVGALAAVGLAAVEVFARPRVEVISTGDELVSVDAALRPATVRDINSATLSAAVAWAGGEPVSGGLVRDEAAELRLAVSRALSRADLVVVSGGSSVGAKDMVAGVLNSLGEPGVLVHGLSLKPGKPTVIAVVGSRPVFGLPGHPVSALVVFGLFVRPLILRLSGLSGPGTPGRRVAARLARNISSAAGREDYVPVALREEAGGLVARPVPGRSGLISMLVAADGVAVVPAGREGIIAGETVEVELFREG